MSRDINIYSDILPEIYIITDGRRDSRSLELGRDQIQSSKCLLKKLGKPKYLRDVRLAGVLDGKNEIPAARLYSVRGHALLVILRE